MIIHPHQHKQQRNQNNEKHFQEQFGIHRYPVFSIQCSASSIQLIRIPFSVFSISKPVTIGEHRLKRGKKSEY
jgi:hypothetical protein